MGKIRKLFKFPASIYLLAATTFYATNRSDHSLPFLEPLLRSSRAVSTIALTVADYKYSLHGLPPASQHYTRQLSEVHLRSASRILKLCETNKGFYIKAGQFVAAMRQVPKEYSSVLSALQDQVVPCDFKAIKRVLISNLGQDLSDIFVSFDEQPIAAASIAQVHHAILRDNREVAIKVQYPGLEHKMRLDTTIMSFLSRFEWLVSEFTSAISLELDFIQEAKNSERTAKNFRNNYVVWVPQVFWDLTSSQVLTMEFCQGCKVDDLEFLKEMKVNPIKVAKALVEAFAEMIFVHGFVNGDPHPGNILVSPEGQHGFSLVLLDHGTYRTLDETFRVNYCQLWKALIFLDSDKIQQIGEQFGVGKYSRYFPLIFTGRTVDSGLLRSIIRRLGAPQRIRLRAYAKYAFYGLSPKLNPESDFAIKTMFYRLKAMASYLQLKLFLETLELLSWMNKCDVQYVYVTCHAMILPCGAFTRRMC